MMTRWRAAQSRHAARPPASAPHLTLTLTLLPQARARVHGGVAQGKDHARQNIIYLLVSFWLTLALVLILILR